MAAFRGCGEIDEDNVVKFAQDHKIQFSTYKDLTINEDINKLIHEEVKAVNDTLSRVEQVKNLPSCQRSCTMKTVL